MSPQPMFRPEPPLPSRPEEPSSASPSTGPEWVDENSGLYLAELAATLASHGGGALSADLALDLLLNEVVEQACAATNATGAAIALARDRQMVCRATSGVNAPGLGVQLNTRSGLSGACCQTKEAQRCDDTESDPRVDPVACRELDVRSILVVPVLDEQELLGVFEIFSTQPAAFSENDVEVLQGYSRRIVENIRQVTSKPAPPPPIEIKPAVKTRSALEPRPEFASPGILFGGSEPPTTRLPRRDRWTGVLIAIVVALALLLGWMLGRVGRQGTASLAEDQGLATSSEPATTPATMPETTNVPQVPVAQGSGESSTPHSVPTRPVDSEAPNPPPPSPHVAAQSAASSPGGLTVYENGKLIYKMPAKKPHETGTEFAGLRSAETGSGESASSATPAPIAVSTEAAWAHLSLRVEPDYPEEARRQRVQGPVVLKALVGKDGVIRKLTVISGDHQLATAATDAVRQWRFKPYVQKGQPREFETQITVNFTLPEEGR